MRREDQRIYVLRVWIERESDTEQARWRASLSDGADGRRTHYFSSLTLLRDLFDPWPTGPR